MTTDLITWLRAQLDWAETDAGEDHTLACKTLDVGAADADADLIDPDACDCPVRPRLLDVQAKRQILDLYEAAEDRSLGVDAWTIMKLVVAQVALSYADRPGYREEWRP